jgi:hypothetical protein
MSPPKPEKSIGKYSYSPGNEPKLPASTAWKKAPFEPQYWHRVCGMTWTLSGPDPAPRKKAFRVTKPSFRIALTASLSLVARIWPPKGPKLSGATAGPSFSMLMGRVATTEEVAAPLTLQTVPFSHVKIMLFPNVPTWSNVIPV